LMDSLQEVLSLLAVGERAHIATKFVREYFLLARSQKFIVFRAAGTRQFRLLRTGHCRIGTVDLVGLEDLSFVGCWFTLDLVGLEDLSFVGCWWSTCGTAFDFFRIKRLSLAPTNSPTSWESLFCCGQLSFSKKSL